MTRFQSTIVQHCPGSRRKSLRRSEFQIVGRLRTELVSAPSGLGHDHIAGWGSRPSGEIASTQDGGVPPIWEEGGGVVCFRGMRKVPDLDSDLRNIRFYFDFELVRFTLPMETSLGRGRKPSYKLL